MKAMQKTIALILALCTLITAVPAAYAEENLASAIELPVAETAIPEETPVPEPATDEETLPLEVPAETAEPDSASVLEAAEPSPAPTPEPTAESAAEETPAPTVEATAEAAPESTPAATAKATVEPTPEATAEATTEATAEPMPVVTAEATQEPAAETAPDAEITVAPEASMEATADTGDAELFPQWITLKMGESYQLAIAQHPDYAGKVRFSSDSDQFFHVDANGLITGYLSGYSLVYADMGDKRLFTCAVSVEYAELPAVPVEGICFPTSSVKLTTADSKLLFPKLLPIGAQGSLHYSIADSNIAEVDQDGRLRGLRTGETTLTVTADTGASASLQVIIEPEDARYFNIVDGVVTSYGGDSRYVVVPDGVTAIGRHAFRYKRHVKTVTLPDSCTRIDDEAFYSSSVEEVYLPEGLTSIGNKAFASTLIQDIQLPASLKTIGQEAFRGSPLQSIDLPEGLESLGTAAFSSTQINNLKLPGSLGVIESSPSFGGEVLEFGEGITEVRFCLARAYSTSNVRKIIFPSTIQYISPNFIEDGVRTGYVKFYGSAGSVAEQYCTNHPNAHMFTFVPFDSIREDENFLIEGNVLSAYKGSSAEVTVPDGITAIGRDAFAGQTHVTSVTLPDGIKEILSSAFKDCTNLTEINLPASLEIIDESAFRSCRSLEEIDLPASLKRIQNYAFQDCASIRSITIPGSIEFLGVDCFNNCTALERMTHLEGYHNTGDFEGCTSLKSVSLPETLTSIGSDSFKGCTSLKEIDLPENLDWLGSNAFEGSALEEIHIPDGVKVIHYSAFKDCTSLRSVHLPKNLQSILHNAFQGCSSLTSVYIPQGTYEITKDAFRDCASIRSIYIPASVKEIADNVFLNCPNLTISTPSGSFAAKYCQTNGIPWARPDISAKYIRFPEGNLTLGVGQAYQLKCEADSDYALGTVSFSSSSAKVVSVDRVTGEIKALKTGSATITAKAQSGAKASCKITVRKAPDSIEFAETEIILGLGERMQLSCILPKNTAAGLSFEGSNFFALHVEPDGWITAVGPGTDTVTVTTHNGVSASCTVIVPEAPSQVILGQTEISIPQSLSCQLNPAVNEGSICRNFSYASSDPAIASVDEKGLVSAHAMGTVQITVSVAAAPEVFAVCNVTVTDPPPRIVLASEALTLGLKESFDLKPGYDGDFSGSFSCASSSSKVVSVTGSGVITAKKAGTAVITVTGENGLSAACKVTVKKAPSSIKLSAANLKLGAGENMQLAYTLSSGSAGSVRFECSNPEIAEISAGGTIRAKAPGSTEILARTYNGKKASAKLTVYAAPESIALERIGSPLKLGVGESGTLGVNFNAGSFGSYRFESSDSNIVEIDAGGKFRAKMLGECSITVTAYNGVPETRKVQVCMPPKKLEFDSYYGSKVTIGVGQKQPLYLYYYAENNVPCGPGLSFKSSNTKVATVDVNGVVTGLKPGTATITVTSFNGLKDTSRITVKKAPTAISLNANELWMGYCETFPLEAVLTPSGCWGNVQYSISDESAAWFNDRGLLLANRRQGSVVVTATTYNGLSASCTVHFGPEPGYVKFPQEEITLCVGMQLPLDFESDGYFSSYSVKTSDKKIAHVDDDGMLIAKKKGSTEITVETYNKKSAVLKVTVEPAPKKYVLDLPMPLHTGRLYKLLDYFSSTPSYDPMLLVKSISINNDRALLSKEADGWYLLPVEAGSITLTIKTLNSSMRVKATIVPGADPGLPDISSPVDPSAVFSDYTGTWKLVCLGSISDGQAISPEMMGVNPYIINVHQGTADIISDDNSLYGFPAYMDGHTLILDTIGNKIPAQLHQNGYLTLPQETEGVHLWFEKQ